MSRSAAAPSASGGTAYVIFISAVAATGGFLFGYDTAVVNGTIGALERHFSADAGRLGFAVASALLGSAVGALIGGRVADRSGRVRAMRITALLFAVSSFGSGLAETLWSLSSWRLLGGIAVGAALAAAAQWSANWLVTLTFPWLAREMGLGFAYGLYTAAAALSFLLVARYVKETKGRTLEEM